MFPQRLARIGRSMFVAALLGPASLPAQVGSCTAAPTALVLAGGGAKGFAHVGLLRTLDSLGVVPDYIVGTSIGAIVGAMYASGLPGATIDSLLRALPLSAVIKTYQPHVSRTLEGLRPVVVWERTERRWVLQAGSMRESEVNAMISRLLLRGNLLARGNFDSLPIPFRAVAADLSTRRPVSIGTGDLAEAVRASFSLPVVLRPMERDSLWLTDGGVASNVPVAIARALGAQRLIVSTLPSATIASDAFEDPISMTSAMLEYIWVQDSLGLGPDDVHVPHPTQTFSSFDFDSLRIDSLVTLGRRTADSVFASGVCARPLRGAPRVVAMPTRIGRTRLRPSGVRDREALIRETGLRAQGALESRSIERGFERFSTSDRYQALWLSPSGVDSTVDFDLRVVPAPRRSFGLGFAFDHLMSGRFWVGGVDRSLFGRDLEGAALFATGTYRTDLMVAARRRARIGSAFWPIGTSLGGFTEDVRLFSGAGELPPAKIEELFVITGLRPLFESGWTYDLGADYRLWREPGLGTRGAVGARGAIRYRLAGAPAPVVEIEGITLTRWQRVRADLSATQRFGTVEVRPRIRAGWGIDLPVQHTFTLGGLDGFAGLRMLELRGDQEAFASLLVRWPLWRQLKGRFEPMAGVIGNGPGILERRGPTDGLIHLGARIGVELESPIGPIRLEQGFNNQDRREALIRVGYWF